ncbi:hypothetical protein [Pseudanabaena sp. FACHB-2040]|uniref:hypothetical protein n=1 Tax=Pseudanabaena sp. FACHB-2040 TaxID=2692859 RepID=UPI001685B45B|nr:hypothetical protein [Pseudanabaena sp. FACHB-2040]MBD2256242.1 hypothetical protein [Pseudanabaena sp. FACHB-2040]
MAEQQPERPDALSIEMMINNLLRSEKRANRMILIGAPNWVRGIIRLLHISRIAEVKDWSRLMQTRNPNEVISLMHRPRADE